MAPEGAQRGLITAPTERAMTVAGVMSGTSADGIDVALVCISGRGWKKEFELLAFSTFAYKPAERERILAACNAQKISVAEIARLNSWLGERIGHAVLDTCKRAKLPLERLDLVASHGQTIYHQGDPEPYLGRPIATTLQLGEAACIAEITGVPVIADFRVADVAAGGKGAPLVPYLDYLLLRDRHTNRVALNIGGIANITVVPADAAIEDVIAFDTGPGNMVIDALAARFSSRRERFDRNGRGAAKGKVVDALLSELLKDAFYGRVPPKTAGREQYGEAFVARLLSLCGPCTPADALATATALTARTIARGLQITASRTASAHWEVVVSGGGVHNRTLMRMLADAAPGFSFRTADEFGLPADAKEAIAFAVLGHASLHGEPANVIAATGARRSAILGKLVQTTGRLRPVR